MKTKVFLTVLILSIISVYGQSNKYTKAMSDNLEKAKSVKSINDLQELANTFA